MMMTIPNPTEPEPKFRIGEREPLFWLVSVLFTETFWRRDDLTRAKFGLFGFGGGNDEMQPAQYADWLTMYQAVEEWAANDPAASACLAHAKEAIVAGELSYFSPEPDEWGDKPYHAPERDVDSYPFLQWAERNGYPIGEDVINAVRTTIHMALSRKQSQEQEAWAFPTISADDLERLQKRPLWNVAEAIMFVMGRRAKNEGKEIEFGKSNTLFKRLLQCVTDAELVGDLPVKGYDHSYTLDEKRKPLNLVMLEAKVKPSDFLPWAKNLALPLPLLAATTAPHQAAPVIPPSYCTPDMALMFDAIEKFWSEYDLAKPNPSVAPVKKDVVAWLVEEAAKRGLSDFSESRAKVLDTIMRCPEARKGGNTL